jgi:hypothetical protein
MLLLIRDSGFAEKIIVKVSMLPAAEGHQKALIL